MYIDYDWKNGLSIREKDLTYIKVIYHLRLIYFETCKKKSPLYPIYIHVDCLRGRYGMNAAVISAKLHTLFSPQSALSVGK